MNTRERFLALMNFEPVDRTLKWELGYWAGTQEEFELVALCSRTREAYEYLCGRQMPSNLDSVTFTEPRDLLIQQCRSIKDFKEVDFFTDYDRFLYSGEEQNKTEYIVNARHSHQGHLGFDISHQRFAEIILKDLDINADEAKRGFESLVVALAAQMSLNKSKIVSREEILARG